MTSLNLGASIANHRAGGRTRLASMVAAAVVLLAVLLLGPAIAVLPRVVIAGMLFVVGVQLFDQWSLRLLVRTLTGKLIHWRRMALDLLVALLVAATILVFDPVVGVAMGVAVAVLFFIVRMSRSAVRRTYHGDAVRSRKARDPKLADILAAHGRRIVVFELEGPIFFGTAEDLATRVEAAATGGADHVVFDLRRVNELDTTGARILIQIHERLKRQGRRLLFSHAHDSYLVSTVLRDLGVAGTLGGDGLFADTDAALEWAEEQVIRAHGAGEALTGEIAMDRLSALEGLTETEVAVVGALLVRRVFSPGEVVIKEGSLDRDLPDLARDCQRAGRAAGAGQGAQAGLLLRGHRVRRGGAPRPRAALGHGDCRRGGGPLRSVRGCVSRAGEGSSRHRDHALDQPGARAEPQGPAGERDDLPARRMTDRPGSVLLPRGSWRHAMIRKVRDGYRVLSESGRSMGARRTEGETEKRPEASRGAGR